MTFKTGLKKGIHIGVVVQVRKNKKLNILLYEFANCVNLKDKSLTTKLTPKIFSL